MLLTITQLRSDYAVRAGLFTRLAGVRRAWVAEAPCAGAFAQAGQMPGWPAGSRYSKEGASLRRRHT